MFGRIRIELALLATETGKGYVMLPCCQGRGCSLTLRMTAVIGSMLSIILAPPLSVAQITMDGSLGPSGTLKGPDYRIGANLGQQRGGNLFHSFGDFNIHQGESATFTGPDSVHNVIGRVTGGNPSSIDGQLRSEIPDANVYLLNPSGVMFGPNATLDVKGSFHVSTADYAKMADGKEFHADLGKNSTLSIAPPEAFGFVRNNPAAISLQGSTLRAPAGKSLSIVGGSITATGGMLSAPAGRVNLVSIAAKGTVRISEQGVEVDAAQLGTIRLSQQHRTSVTREGGGTISIRGGELLIDQSTLDAESLGDKSGGGISIRVSGDVTITNAGKVQVGASSRGNAGTIEIEGKNLTVSGGSKISSVTHSVGDGGAIKIRVSDSVTVSDFAEVLSEASVNGDAGVIILSASRVVIDDGAIGGIVLGIGEGADVILIATESLRITGLQFGEAGILSDAVGNGPAGKIFISSPLVEIQGSATIETRTIGDGNAGTIEIEAERVLLGGGGQIGSTSGIADVEAGEFVVGKGKGGAVTVTATDRIELAGQSADGIRSGIFSQTASTSEEGQGGIVSVNAPRIIMTDGARIGTDTGSDASGGNVRITAEELSVEKRATIGSESGIDVGTRLFVGNGHGGDVQIEATKISLKDGGTISARSRGTGNAGNLAVHATDTFHSHGGIVTTNARSAQGGQIAISAGRLVQITGDSQVTTSVQSDIGDAGKITIAGDIAREESGDAASAPRFIIRAPAQFVVLDGKLLATAVEGRGGNIEVAAKDAYLASTESETNVRSERGISGTVDVRAPVTSISGTFAPLPEEFLTATELLPEQCSIQLQHGHDSSFMVIEREGIPQEPGSFMLSPLY